MVFNPDALRFLITMAGAGKVMLGTDYPFPIGDLQPMTIVNAIGLSEADRTAIAGSTAAELFAIRD